MHSAPTVSYPVGRSRFQGQLISVLFAIAGVAGLAWCATVDVLGWRQALFFALLSIACLVLGRAWRRSAVGTLAWSGDGWRCRTTQGVVSGELGLHLDLQFCMLLSLRSNGGGRLWVWSERRTAPALWLALRRAVMSSPVERAFLSGAQASDLLKP